MFSRQGMPMLAAAALLLPAIIALSVWLWGEQDDQRSAVEREAMGAAEQVLALTDAQVTADSRLLGLMSASPANEIPAMLRTLYERALSRNDGWVALVLRDARSGKVLIEQARSIDYAPLHPLPAELSRAPLAEGVWREGRYCPCVVYNLETADDPGKVLTLFVSPRTFQTILTRHGLARTVVSAVADRHAAFIARSLDFDLRVGTPGSLFLRRAVARGGTGIYSGVTLEGARTYTAYVTSPQTGWSAHVAVDRDDIDNPRFWARASVAVATLAALILAAALSFFAAYEARRRRLEEARMMGLQKAEAIGQFTAIMVHDFRNILAAADAGVQLILRHTKEELTASRARSMEDALQRGSRVINQMLSFVRGESAAIRTLDIHQVLERADHLIGRSLGEQVQFRWSVDEDARFARGNGDQLELALLNLAINARDAMDGLGEFTILVRREGDFAAVSASDSGPGVPPPLRDRIFEAFYSTKGDRGGTGLGLAQVAGAARQAGGRVELIDSPGGGACFVIYLPLAESAEP